MLKRIAVVLGFHTHKEFYTAIESPECSLRIWRQGNRKPAPKYLIRMLDMVLARHAETVRAKDAQIAALESQLYDNKGICHKCPLNTGDRRAQTH
jgi:hypothetical protein